jgi:hypothetical protein
MWTLSSIINYLTTQIHRINLDAIWGSDLLIGYISGKFSLFGWVLVKQNEDQLRPHVFFRFP